jgi:hypothetical protein
MTSGNTVQFTQNEESVPFAFAGIWTTINGDRGTKSKPVPGPSGLRFPDDCAERRGRADPSQGDAGDPHD